MILGKRYYDPYEMWIKVGWALHNTDYRLFLAWVKFSSKSEKFSYDEIGEMYRKWNEMRDEGYTAKSIMWWAKDENEKEYQKVKEQTIDYYVNITVAGRTEYDIAMVLYQLYKDQFKCASHRNKIWYEFKDSLWVESEEGTTLRRKLSKKLSTIYINKICEKKDMVNNDMTDEEHNAMLTTCKSLLIVSEALRKTASKNNIMKEAQDIFYEKNFILCINIRYRS